MQIPLVAKAESAPDCTKLNNPSELGEWIVTVVEEQIVMSKTGEAPAEAVGESDTHVRDCFRVTSKKGEKFESEYQASCTGAICEKVQVFFSKSGTGLLYAYIGLIYRWAAGTIGLVCVLVLIINGILITVAGDNTGKVDEAKQRIVQSLAGLALLFMSAALLWTINPNFFTIQ